MPHQNSLLPFFASSSPVLAAQAAAELESIAPEIACHGLALTHAQALGLAAAQAEALAAAGRVEFGSGILKRLALAFCDSPCLVPATWADTLAELQDLFYQLKGVCGERLGDATLLKAMRLLYDAAGGDTDYLAGADAATLLAAAHGERPAALDRHASFAAENEEHNEWEVE